MKIRFTSVITQDSGGVLTGLATSYEATDSDGAGNIGTDTGGLLAPQTGAPTYADLATVQSLTQTQIYNDFYDTTVVDSEIIGEVWKSDLQDTLDIRIKTARLKTQLDAGTLVIDKVEEIGDQTPIDI